MPGKILMHARTHIGTRVEETARQFAEIEKTIRRIIPPEDLGTVVDNIGLPSSGINMTYNTSGTFGASGRRYSDRAERGPSADRGLRAHAARAIAAAFSGGDFLISARRYHQPDSQFRRARSDRSADSRPFVPDDFAYAERLLRAVRHVPGLVDARIQQALDYPAFNVNVDRTRAQYVGLTERDVTNSLVVNLAGSSQVAPTYWLNPANGVNYPIVMQTPQYQIELAQRTAEICRSPRQAAGAQTLGAIADIKRTATPAVYSQYNIVPMVQIYGTTQGRDLGAVAADIRRVMASKRARRYRKGTSRVCSARSGP